MDASQSALNEVDPPPLWLLPAYFLSLILTLAVPPFPGRKAASVAAHAFFTHKLLSTTLGNFSNDYPFASAALPLFLMWAAFVMLGEPEKELYKLSSNGTMDRRTLWQRLMWSLGIWINPRGVGWSYQGRGLRIRNVSKT
jgi:hypothetical protein